MYLRNMSKRYQLFKVSIALNDQQILQDLVKNEIDKYPFINDVLKLNETKCYTALLAESDKQ